MKEENLLENAVVDVLQGVTSSFSSAKDFVVSELPDVVEELLIWKFSVSLISFVCCLLLVSAIVVANYYQFKAWQKSSYGWDGFEIINAFQLLWAIPIGALFSLDWLQIWLAPKIYLIEYTAALVK